MNDVKTPDFWVMVITNIVVAIVGVLTVRGALTPEEGEEWVKLAGALALPVALLVLGWVNKGYISGQQTIREARIMQGSGGTV